MAALRIRTSSKPDGTKVITFVVGTNSSSCETMSRLEHSHQASDEKAGAAKRKGKSRLKAENYVALRISTPPNIYLVGSRQRASEIAKRAGILDDEGKLTPFFQGVHCCDT